MDIQSILSALVRIIDETLFSSAGGLWYLTVKYGLSPGYAFLGNFVSSPGFLSVYSFFFNGFYVGIMSLVLIIASLYFLARNSAGLGVSLSNSAMRALFAMAISLFSFDICTTLLYYVGQTYSAVWMKIGTDWYALSPAAGLGGSQGIPQVTSSTVLSFFFLSSYYIATGSLLSVMEVRQAILLVLIVILPIFSTLFIIPQAEKVPLAMWTLFAEMLVVPFLVLICIAIAEVFPENPLLQIALIMVASSSPFLMRNSYRIMYGAGMMGTFSGLMAGMSSMRYGVAGTVADTARRYGSGLTLSFKGTSGPVDVKESDDFRVDWGELFRREFYNTKGEV